MADPDVSQQTALPRPPPEEPLGERAGMIGWPITAGPDQSQAGTRVSLWWAPLDVSAPALRGLAASLSPEERQRTDRFRRPLPRQRVLAARGWLRYLLASELRCAPADMQIVTDAGGKPRLARSELHFSTARSAGIALYATSWTTEVGVDVEAIRATADLDRIAARFFSRAEQRALAFLAPAQRVAAFFQCWTRKEAYVKGIGAGLSFPLPAVEVWDGDGRPARVFGWSVHQVDVGPRFAAAVAGAGIGWVSVMPRNLAARSRTGSAENRDHPVTPAVLSGDGRENDDDQLGDEANDSSVADG